MIKSDTLVIAVMEDKLNQLLADGDYYSAHQVVLSLTKRKVKLGKTEEAIAFVEKAVIKLVEARQYASACDLAMSVFEYAEGDSYDAILSLLKLLLQSPDAHYWRPFLSEVFAKFPECRETSCRVLLESPYLKANGDLLAATSTAIVQVSNAKRVGLLEELASIIASEACDVHVHYLCQVSVALIRDGQFGDAEVFLKKIVATIGAFEGEVSSSIAPVAKPEWNLVNFCILLHALLQRKAPPRTLFTELLKEYLTEYPALSASIEASLTSVYWPSPRARAAGGPPPDLMNMLSGLLRQ